MHLKRCICLHLPWERLSGGFVWGKGGLILGHLSREFTVVWDMCPGGICPGGYPGAVYPGCIMHRIIDSTTGMHIVSFAYTDVIKTLIHQTN